ncbi:PorV/PorQ family protein [Foetidibacter luteolus]|uniref:PorV/PorQ family protein n=1 Tax=Foetidibacter luteolus TaxID=2608880 RepID=UPI00129A27C0|nr:PorV/PorQ family protein [Foetidibacter luteolus]
MKKIVQLLTAMAAVVAVTPVMAQDHSDSLSINGLYQASPVAVPFLRMNQDIRSAGIGETGVALPGDNVTHYANPARMVQVQSKSAINVAYTPWMTNLAKNIALYSVSGYYKFSDEDVFTAGVRYFKQGRLQMTDDYGQSLGESSPYDMALDLSYARKITDELHIGASFRYINSRIISGSYDGYRNGSAVGADLGLYYQSKANVKGQSWHLGMALTNIGSKVKYGAAFNSYQLPTNLALGVAFKQKIEDDHELIFSTEFNKLLVAPANGKNSFGNTLQYNFGGEYTYNSMFSVRAGYSHESKTTGGLQFITTGIGLKYKVCRFDMAYLLPSGKGAGAMVNNTFKLGLGFILK